MAKSSLAARRDAQRRGNRQQAVALTVIALIGLGTAIIPALLTAAILVPMAYAERGGAAMGGEWIAVGFVFCATYSIAHKGIVDKFFGRRRKR